MHQIRAEPIKPFLKWPGGKRWVAPIVSELVRERLVKRYFEPFLGGAAVYFHLRPGQATLSDINSELINTYRIVRDRVEEVLTALRRMPVSERAYYKIRSIEPPGATERAARFLYLNRVAFAGMFRLNQQGHFNVPYGGGVRGIDIFWRTSMLSEASSALQNADLRQHDFESMLESARTGDVVYCDPTYTVTHDNNGFVRYNERNFSWTDQERLATAAFRAKRRGASVIVSNACHREIKKIYRQAELRSLSRWSTLSADPSKRRLVREYLAIL